MNQNDRSLPDESKIRIRWEVPLPWLLGGALFLGGQAAILYFGQIRQGELIAEQSSKITDMTKQVRDLNTLIGSNNLKDVEHDLKLADHERRMIVLEARLK